LREIKLLSIKDELKGIYLEIKKAEGEKNTEKVNELVKEFSQRSKKIISS
jgi:hypothetical protein